VQDVINWSLITVTYNSARALRRFANNLDLGEDVEWIVVDNASSDDSAAVAREFGAHVIALEKNVGFGPANNVGLRSSRSLYVGFVNPDLQVQVADLPALARHLEMGREHLVAPQRLEVDGSLQPNGRGLPSLFRKVLNRTPWPHDGYRLYAREGNDRLAAWIMGAAVFAKRSTFEKLGAWDERFFVGYEDHDLGLRAWKEGLPVVVHGDIRWTHGWARETTSFRLRPWLIEFDGMVRFFSRYPSLAVHHNLFRRGERYFHNAIGSSTDEFTPADSQEGVTPYR